MSAHKAVSGFESDRVLDEVFERCGPSDVDAIDPRITAKRKYKNFRQVKTKMDLRIRLVFMLMLALMTLSLDVSAAILPLVVMLLLVSQVKTRLYGPLGVDAFIDLQFKSTLPGEEEIVSSSHGETVTTKKKMVAQVGGGRATAAKSNTVELTFGSDTQENLDHTLSPNKELNSSGLICPSCRENTDQEDFKSCCNFNSKTTRTHDEAERTKECADAGIEFKEILTDPRNAIVTELQLADISDDVGTCWRELGPKLKIASSKIHNLDEEHKSNWNKANALLIMWKHQEGSKATVGHLADVLKSIRRKSIAEKLLNGESKAVMPTVVEGDGEVITLTVKCNLNAELNKVVFCEDTFGNKFILKGVDSSKGQWNSRKIQKNEQFLETVAAAAQDMEKTTEQRRQESLKRISSEVQELRKQLKRCQDKLDCSDSETCAGISDPNENEQPTNLKELLNDTKMPLQVADHLLHSWEEQHKFCQVIFNALIKLIGVAVGQPRDLKDNFMSIKSLYDLLKELKDQERIFLPGSDPLDNLKQHLDKLQVAQVEELEKRSWVQKKQVEELEKLLSSLFNHDQGKNEKNQRSRTNSTFKRSWKSRSVSEHPDVTKTYTSSPRCAQQVLLLDTADKKLKE